MTHGKSRSSEPVVGSKKKKKALQTEKMSGKANLLK
jgi:hypothetical protein